MIDINAEGLDDCSHVLDHIGLLTEDVEQTIQTLASILSIVSYTHPVIDTLQDVKAIFAKTSKGLLLEFLEPISDESPIKNSIKKNQNLIHHLAYRTDDIERSTKIIRNLRGMPISKMKPGIAFDNSSIQFFLLPSGWLIELIEQPVSTMKFPLITKYSTKD